MNRRGFLTSLGALATSAALPKIPSIPIAHVNPIVLFIAMNSIYGKIGPRYTGGYYQRLTRLDGIVTTDIVSAYPHDLKTA